MLLVTVALLLRRQPAALPDSEAELAFHRLALAAVETDVEAGRVTGDEAEARRTEVARRLIRAAAASPEVRALRDRSPAVPIGAAVVLGLALYAALGSPMTADLPVGPRRAALEAAHDARIGQEEAEAAAPTAPDRSGTDYALALRLETALADRPADLAGQQLLAETWALLGDYPKARAAMERVLAIKGDRAPGRDHILLAELMIRAAGLYVSPEAERSIARGLTLEPANPLGRYYSGLTLVQAGRPDLALPLWTQLLAEGPEEAPWISPIRAALPQLAAAAGRSLPESVIP